MKPIHLLIVEDDPAQIQSYTDVLEQHNKSGAQEFTFEMYKTFKEGEAALKTPNFDAAIIDLKLSGSEELEGKVLVQSVYRKLRIPIIVYSGSIAMIDDIPENPLLLKKLRTVGLPEILTAIQNIYRTGITGLMRADGIIDNKLTEIFWTHLADDLSTWIRHNNHNALLRHIIMLFQEHLDIGSDGNFDEYHPYEVYVRPPIRMQPHTGDIFEGETGKYLLLTPACDMVVNYKSDGNGGKIPKRKAEKIILVRTKDFDVKTACINAQTNKLDKDIIDKMVSNQNFRYHYLPAYDSGDGFIVDFQDIQSVDSVDQMERVATVSSPFLKDIIARFSNYYARQGQPTYNQKGIVNDLFNRHK